MLGQKSRYFDGDLRFYLLGDDEGMQSHVMLCRYNNMVQYGTACMLHYGAVWYDTEWYGIGTVRYDTESYNTERL